MGLLNDIMTFNINICIYNYYLIYLIKIGKNIISRINLSSNGFCLFDWLSSFIT